jgi:ketosteroid isomerase-like protein
MNKMYTTALAMMCLLGMSAQSGPEAAISSVLDQWHAAAARADFEGYFGYMAPEAVFIGTDATEYWTGEEFKAFAKPYFDKGKAWSFKSVERHVYVDEKAGMAWFDELLDTQMKLCRGSGVMKKVGGSWKIAHYVLSIAVPNDDVDQLVALKKETDSLLVQKLTKRQ